MVIERLVGGLDHGYSSAKDSAGNLLASCIREGRNEKGLSSLVEVQVDNKYYVIDTKYKNGNRLTGLDKTSQEADREILKVLTLASMYKSSTNDHSDVLETNTIIGLPISYFGKQKQVFADCIKEQCNGVKVAVNGGKLKTVLIKKLEVVPQSAALCFKYEEEFKALEEIAVVDFGFQTIDVSFFNHMNLTDGDGIPRGMIELYTNMASVLNDKYYTKVKPLDMEDILDKGTVKDSNGNIHDLSCLDSLKETYAREVISDLKDKFSRLMQVDKVFIIGGGVEVLQDLINKNFGNQVLEVVENPRFANAEAFGAVAKKMFNK